MIDPVLVGLGGVAGAASRHLLGERIDRRTADTFAVNVAGSIALGLLVGLPVDGDALLVLGTGFCGAFTTFSTFAFETVRLAETGETRRAAVTAVANLVGALLAVALGLWLASIVA